jgi:predicted outer membrane lipoprotein
MIFLFLNEVLDINVWILLGMLINAAFGVIAFFLFGILEAAGNRSSEIPAESMELADDLQVARMEQVSNRIATRAWIYLAIGLPALLVTKLAEKYDLY